MNRNDELSLLEFCTAQHDSFNADAWRSSVAVPADLLATVALFLANATWFGHAAELREVAERLAPAERFPQLVRRTRFDFSRFDGMLKMRIRHACPLS